MSQMIVTGSRNAKSSIRSMRPWPAIAIERFIDDLLDARTHVLDPARGKRLHHQAAQARVVGRILLQHPMAHAAKDRLLHDLRSIAPHRPLDIILAEALVAQNQTGFGVPAGDVRPRTASGASDRCRAAAHSDG